MNYVGRLLSNFKGFYNEINSATLTGAIDVIIVKREDGTYVSSPFHVRFGKMGVLQPREKVVDMEINGKPVELHMKLGEAGEAFFVKEEVNGEVPEHLATSPIPSTSALEMMEAGLQSLRKQSILQDQYELSEEQEWEKAALETEHLSTDYESEYPALEIAIQEQLFLSPKTSISGPIETDVGTQTATPPMSPRIGKDTLESDTNIVTNVDLPKKDSQISLYHSVHTSFEHGFDEDDRSIDNQNKANEDNLTSTPVKNDDDQGCAAHKAPIVCLEYDGKCDVATQTNMTGEEVVATVAKSSTTSVHGVTSSDESVMSLLPSTSSILTSPVSNIDTSSLSSAALSVAEAVPSLSKLSSSSSTSTGTRTKISSQKKKRRKKIERKRREMLLKDNKFSNVEELNEGDNSSVDGSTNTPDSLLFDMDLSADESVDELTMSRTVSMPIIDDSRRNNIVNDWAGSHHASAFHPFSDGDITPVMSPIGTRPPSPKSDTEYETNQHLDAVSQTFLTGDQFETIDEVKWRWGELPESTPRSSLADNKDNGRDDMKADGGLFNFMRKTKKVRHQPEQEGIYLEDLNLEEMEPEVAALYIYHPKGPNSSQLLPIKDEDTESGRGGSLPQSPVSHEHQQHDITTSSGTSMSSNTQLSNIAMSLCGGLKECEGDVLPEKFDQMQVTIGAFSEDPGIINNPNLVVRIDNKYYNWQIAGPIIMASLAFGSPLPLSTIESLIKQHMPKTVRKRGWIWWRNNDAETGTVSADGKIQIDPTVPGPSGSQGQPLQNKTDSPKQQDPSSKAEGEDWSAHEGLVDPELTQTDDLVSAVIDKNIFTYRKSLKLTSEQIEMLHLVDGANDISFSVTTQYQGTSRSEASIFLWNWDDQIIISDIDGTITKSDVLGQLLPMVGKDWSQAGIANLYNEIHRNGYKFLYLSARAIGQSKITRDYIRGLQQEKLSLPEGPLLLSPSSLISAFHREVIEKKPEEFKISCLRDISALFPTGNNPFYAGFGNKINDVWAYRAMKIPISRIFTVNHKGELRMELTHAFQSTYTKLSDIADHFFPPLVHKDAPDGASTSRQVHAGNFPASEEFSTFTYWREPLVDIGTDLVEFKTRDDGNIH